MRAPFSLPARFHFLTCSIHRQRDSRRVGGLAFRHTCEVAAARRLARVAIARRLSYVADLGHALYTDTLLTRRSPVSTSTTVGSPTLVRDFAPPPIRRNNR